MAVPKLTPEQMLARCDIAGLARVVSVGRDNPHGSNFARLAMVRLVKGAPRERDGLVTVRLHGGGAPRRDADLNSWSDWWDYPVGAVVMTHLDWNGPEDVYETTWPGAVTEAEDTIAKVA